MTPDRGPQHRRFGQPGLGSVLVALVLPASLQALPTWEFETALVAEPGLERPNAVTFSPADGSVCVTDEGGRILAVFDREGFFRFRTSSLAALSQPQDGSIDAGGGFVFTDSTPDRKRTVRRLNLYGEPEAYRPRPPVEGWAPRNLIVTRDGGYVTLDASGLLAKHDPGTGALLWALPIADPQDELGDLIGRPAESPGGEIYVPVSGARSILVVSPDGERLGSFGTRGAKRGELSFPVAVAFGPRESVLVLDRMRHKILVFDTNHDFITEFGRWGASTGDLYHPVAMTASSDGRVWIAQGFEGRVQLFRLRYPEPDTETQDMSSLSSTPAGMPETGQPGSARSTHAPGAGTHAVLSQHSKGEER